MTYDAIVIGARCAGAATAMQLARQGHRVLLVDRATFPSDIPHGHLIHRRGPQRLAQWGLLDRVLATGCPPLTNITHEVGDIALVAHDVSVDGVPAACGPRRTALDRVLTDAAVDAGVELRAGFSVESLTRDGDRVTGIRGGDRRGGTMTSERATIVIGADGRNSHVARAVGAPTYEEVPSLTCWYFSYWADVPSRGLEIYDRHSRAVFAFPTNDGLFAIFVAWPASELPAVRADIERQFLTAIDGIPQLGERVRSGRRAERFYGATDLRNFLRRPYGPGWALVGDAGCHKDPYLALGVCDAFRDAELLATAVSNGLAGHRPLDDALGEYETRRNEATLPEYRVNLERARFTPLSAQERELRAALAGNPGATTRLFLTIEGFASRESFFNPDNLGRILRGASNVIPSEGVA
ncbi:MAG: NAD(P)/FAD-dependent oxidoreductase [Geminicoccaceae bacterium]|nr:NAD(P)/FAD-dependent oxidoreductase [Geminicoccaceae bacterium]